MKTLHLPIVAFAALLVCQSLRAADSAAFFRVVGPAETRITEVRPDGTVLWSNAAPGSTFTFQTTGTPGEPGSWTDWVQVPADAGAVTNRLFDPAPPSGMALIPAGSFTMGNSFSSSEGNSDELPLHRVNVSAFLMDKYEVTWALWQEVYNWATNRPGDLRYVFEYGAQGKAATHPAHLMTWYDAVKWCNARSEKEGKIPAYYTDAGLTVRYRTGQAAPYVNWTKGYRLPTEAEWEKAARGGSAGHRFPWTSPETINHSRANYYAYPLSAGGYAYDVNTTSGYHPTSNDGVMPYTSPVGYFSANANGYGLYDMAGNVWEWCWDWYGAYGSATQTDPRGPSSPGSNRVGRGGGWYSYAWYCRPANRGGYDPRDWFFDLGFRCVLPPGQ
jgi:formylglycine-generating enzyme required for sulfatase activity